MYGCDHLNELCAALHQLDGRVEDIERWSERIAGRLLAGGRLLAAGNGGSAAQAQHLTAELVGRYLHDRPAFSAIALHADTSALTAIVNDYGPDEAFARGVEAHGRPGDVFVALSTSGRSTNVVHAARTARRLGLTVFGLTGRGPNPLGDECDECLCIDADTPTVQEVHQVAVHLLCDGADRWLVPAPADASARSGLVAS
jgi:D-sedoheptulose 7-phosphate isomerase